MDDKLILVVIIVVVVVLIWFFWRKNNHSHQVESKKWYNDPNRKSHDIIQQHPEAKVEFLPFMRKGKPLIVHTPADFSTDSAQAGSNNWSGYVSANSLTQPGENSVSNVVGTFVVPSLVPTTGQNDDNVSIWVGIDGAFGTDPTVQQIGIDLSYENGSTVSYAWFEMYPQPAYEINGFPIQPGDSITVSVSLQLGGNDPFSLAETKFKQVENQSELPSSPFGKTNFNQNGTYILKMVNNTQQVQVTIPTSYTQNARARGQSAEWIVEAPSEGPDVVALSPFTPAIEWSNCSATIGSGGNSSSSTVGPINRFPNVEITMGTPTQVKAQPTSLNSAGTSFSIAWVHT